MKLIDLQGKRVLITQAQDFMGPALVRVFGALGAGAVEEQAGEGDVVDGLRAGDDLLEVDHHEQQAVDLGGADHVAGAGVVLVEEAADQAAGGGVVERVEHRRVPVVG